jgi:dihydrolipoamide dehydrogenase
MALETEVLIIGAGPGGYVGAIKLGQFGKKVILVDKDKLGGECLNYGCIPSKALIHSASQLYEAKNSGAGGLDGGGISLDWSKVQSWKNQLVVGFNRGIASLTKGRGVSLMVGEAVLTGPNMARIKSSTGEEEVHFQHALISTGTRAITLPTFPYDGKKILSSKEALELKSPPKRILVIGAGVIGLELGTVFAKLGSQVTVVEFMPQILPGIDPDFTAPVVRKLQKLGVEVLLQAKAKSFKDLGESLEIEIEMAQGAKTVSVDVVLVTIGRSPSTQNLGLESCGVETDPKGHIRVDEHFRTNIPHIYAVGDVIGPPYLAHKASREAILASLHICGFSTEPRGAVPWAVFTDPEISFVGETEAEIRARNAQVLVGRFPFSASGRAQAMRQPEGFVKVIADKESHKILGAGFVGLHASELIGEAALAVKMGATIEDIASTIHPHPTLSEAFQEAAEAAIGEAIHILAKA